MNERSPARTRAKAERQSGGYSSGPGWGGPARGGPPQPFSADNQPTAESKAAGRIEAETAAEAARPHAVSMVEVWRSIAMDAQAPHIARISAAEKLVERAEGKAVQSSQLLGANGKPIDPVVPVVKIDLSRE